MVARTDEWSGAAWGVRTESACGAGLFLIVLYHRGRVDRGETEDSDGLAAWRQARLGNRLYRRDRFAVAANLAEEGAPVVVNGRFEERVEEEFFQTARPTSLLQRFIEPEEVAEMVAFVCSPASSATSGASLRADGGVVRTVV
jgi:hypothetical protein